MHTARRNRTAAMAALVLAVGCGAPRAAEPDIRFALNRVAQLEGKLDFAGIAEVLGPLRDTNHPDVEFYLAWAWMNLAIAGRQPGAVSAEDIRPALDLSNRAAEHGSIQAWNLLYMIYGNGFGVPVDRARAVEFLRRGVEAGDAGAKINYSIQLYQGSALVERNLAQACRLFEELAEDEGARPAIAYYMGIVVFRGDCNRKPDPAAGMKLVRAAADGGDRDAQRDMGRSNELGWVGPVDMAKAFEWYARAADRGDPHSLWRLGMAYVRGEQRAKDPLRAVDYFRQAAASGNGDGMTSLAVMYAGGEGVGQDYAKARELYEQAVQAGSVHALQNLAVMHLLGQGTRVDPVKARICYLQAIELGDQENEGLRHAIETALDADGIRRSDREFEAWRVEREKEG